MRVVEKFEAPIVKAFEGFPAIPANAKETLVKAWPYLALLFAVFQVLGAYSSWNAMQLAGQFNYYQAFTPVDRAIIYFGIVLSLVESVLLFMAFSPLQQRAKRGWDLLFLGGLLNVAYAVVSLFMTGYGVGSFLMGLLVASIGFYLLVQIREKFTGKVSRVAPHRAKVAAEPKKK